MKIPLFQCYWLPVFRQLTRSAFINEFQSPPNTLLSKCGATGRINALSCKFSKGLTTESKVKVDNSYAMARVLNVAEKNDAAKRIAELLAGGANNIRRVMKLILSICEHSI